MRARANRRPFLAPALARSRSMVLTNAPARARAQPLRLSRRVVSRRAAVEMWVFEEQVNGKNLTEIINETHENVKYLPGIKLPENVHAEPNLEKAVTGATLLIFVLPHQFLPRTVPNMKARARRAARGVGRGDASAGRRSASGLGGARTRCRASVRAPRARARRLGGARAL